MKIVGFCVVSVFLIIVGLVCTGIYNHTSDSLAMESSYKNNYTPPVIKDNAPSQPSIIGMTYNGKIGVNLGGGIIMPIDGSGPKIGFGF